MASDLLAKQQRFARLLGHLLLKMAAEGYHVTMAEGYVADSINKPTEDSPHLRTGGHFHRLAQDLNLFKDGVWLQTSEAHQPFGEWWETQDPDARWGGRWRDGNHYSFEYNGTK